MLRLSWSTFTERWPLFIGAALTVCLGVALVQSSLLVLISAATLDVPAGLSAADAIRFTEGVSVAVTVSALTLGFSAFLAVFIVGSTFAFTVAQRRRDLALLRLAGGGRGQLHRLLLGEAVLLGLAGTAVGVPAGLATMSFQSWLLGDARVRPRRVHRRVAHVDPRRLGRRRARRRARRGAGRGAAGGAGPAAGGAARHRRGRPRDDRGPLGDRDPVHRRRDRPDRAGSHRWRRWWHGDGRERGALRVGGAQRVEPAARVRASPGCSRPVARACSASWPGPTCATGCGAAPPRQRR